MNDPYEILGVRRNASQDEIKKAYKEKVKQYHPDKYRDNPLADLAEEKMQEINEAYDSLTKGMKTGGNSYSTSYSRPSGNQSGQSSANRGTYQNIRVALDRGDLLNAEKMLLNIGARDAEWFFLSGMLSYKKGWYDDALSNINEAVRMDPGNMEYRQVFQSMINRNTGYTNAGDGRGYSTQPMGMGCCETCLCLNCLCGGPGPCCC